MNLAAALLLAAVTAHAQPSEPDRGAQVDSARISVIILRPAVLTRGVLASDGKADSPRSQRQSGDGYVTYLFD